MYFGALGSFGELRALTIQRFLFKRMCFNIKRRITYEAKTFSMKKTQIISLLLLFLISGFSPPKFNYLPAQVGDHQIISYSQFTLSYNEEHEQADWVAYKLTRKEVKKKRERCDCFRMDKKIITESASSNDYRLSGYDRGHLSPAGDNNKSKKSNRESFLMSNMSPQLPGFNRGIWRTLEEWIRYTAVQCGSLYIVTGPIFKDNLDTIGKNSVTVPGYYYKVILKDDGNRYNALAFIIPHKTTSSNIESWIVTVDSVEQLSGLNFFPNLDDNLEDEVESKVNIKAWNFSRVDF